MVAGARSATTLARSVADAIVDTDRLALPVALTDARWAKRIGRGRLAPVGSHGAAGTSKLDLGNLGDRYRPRACLLTHLATYIGVALSEDTHLRVLPIDGAPEKVFAHPVSPCESITPRKL